MRLLRSIHTCSDPHSIAGRPLEKIDGNSLPMIEDQVSNQEPDDNEAMAA